MENSSEEERIRRAEEISYRRQNRIPVNEISTDKSERKLTRFGKLSLQIIISICIFGIIYFINERYTFALEKIKPVMNNDTDFVKAYQTINDVLKNIIQDTEQNNEETIKNNEVANNVEEKKSENIIEQVENQNEPLNTTITNVAENIENIQKSEEEQKTSSEDKKEEDDDVSYIKNKFSFIKPVEGKISSGFGEREATEVISANHQGIDIAVNTGTDVKAAMKGKVKEVSTYGDYGTHIIIENEDVITLYAHLSEALVEEGEEIEQGKIIARTGSTGRSTGPHLHFEIRRNNIAINPQDILDL